jgi:ATP-dependent Zn protease
LTILRIENHEKINFILSIFILSQLGFSLPLKAQSRCQATINSIVNEIESKGVRRVIVEKTTVTNRRNPTNRTNEIIFVLSPYNESYTSLDTRSYRIVSNIIASGVLMKSYADRIVSNCQDIAVVIFGVDQTESGPEFAIQSDGKTRLRDCIPSGSNLTANWNQTYCH